MNYKKSLIIFQIVTIFRAFWLGMFISIIYQKFIGLNDITIPLSGLIMGICIFLFEIPTGVFADKYGYKKSILVSHIFIFLAFVSLVLANFYGSLFALFIAPIFFGIHYAFNSGASQAYIFTIFKLNKQPKKYLKFNSRLGFFMSISTAIASIIGAYLYVLNPIFPYFCQAVLMGIACVLILFLEKLPQSEIKSFSFISQIKESINVFKKQKILVKLFLFLFIVNISFNFFLHVTNQSFWIEKGISIELIGVLGAILLLIEGLSVLITPKMWDYFGEKRAYLVFAILAVIFPIILSFMNDFILITIFSGLVFGVAAIISQMFNYSTQLRIENKTRATVISIGNMFVSFGHKLVLVFLGFTLSFMTYSFSLILTSITFGVIGLIFISSFYKKLH